MFNIPMSLGPLGGNAVADINAAAGAIFIIGFDDLSSTALQGGIYTSGLQADSPVLELTATPLPAALPLFTTGLGALGLLGWRRKRKAQVAA